MAESRNSLNEKIVGIVCELNVPLNAFEYGLPLAGSVIRIRLYSE